MVNETAQPASPRPDDPDLFPFRVDFVRRAVLLLKLSPAQLRDAVFLDERMLGQNPQGGWIGLDDFVSMASQAMSTKNLAPVHFIFHLSHCGSTLLSRMIDEATGALGLRELLPLRDLAVAQDKLEAPDALFSQEEFDRLLGAFLMVWRRQRENTNGAIHIKLTSSAQRLAPALFRCAPDAKAVTLHVSAKNHVATLLAGPNNIFDMRMWGAERMARLTAMAGPPPSPFHALSPGELAALTWGAERAWQHKLLTDPALQARLLDTDFDALLEAPAETLKSVCAHFGMAANESYLDTLPNAAIMKKYAKAPEHEYSPGLRTQVLEQARCDHADEIAKGLTWLKAYAQTAPRDIADLFLGEAGDG